MRSSFGLPTASIAMQMISKYWIPALFVLGVGMLFYAFHYDVSRAGGFSWDAPPELMEPYLPQIAVADRLYQVGWTTCGVAAAGFLARAIIRIARAESGRDGRIAPATPPTPPGMRLRTGRFQ